MNSCFESPAVRLEMSRHTVAPLIEDIASEAWNSSSAEASLFLSHEKPAHKRAGLRSLLSWFSCVHPHDPGEPASLVELGAPGRLYPPASWRFKP